MVSLPTPALYPDADLPPVLRSRGMKGRMLHHAFENFDTENSQQVDVLLAARAYAEKFSPTAGGGLWLLGPSGTGKTHLGCAIARHIEREHRHRCWVLSVREIIRMLRLNWGPATPSQGAYDAHAEDMIKILGEAGLLVLDGVGVSFNTEAEAIQLLDIVDLRYKLCRPTVVISNLPAGEIKTVLGEAVFDRLREGARVLACNWPSARGVNRAPQP